MTSNWYEQAHQELHDMQDGGRFNYIGFPAAEKLEHMCSIIHAAFGSATYGIYLVGSATRTKKFRDVDLRMVMTDEGYDKLFGKVSVSPLWSIICTSISVWASEQTGLPIDFQIQRITDANARYPNGNRNALGRGFKYKVAPHELPVWDSSYIEPSDKDEFICQYDCKVDGEEKFDKSRCVSCIRIYANAKGNK